MSNKLKTETPVPASPSPLEAYRKLYDIISDAVEGGRLKAADLPDDWDAIVLAMLDCNTQEAAPARRAPQTNLVHTMEHGCVRYYDEITQGAESDDEAEANCKLWNAAPELLEALKAALPFIPHTADGTKDVLHPVLSQARAAITKATR